MAKEMWVIDTHYRENYVGWEIFEVEVRKSEVNTTKVRCLCGDE